MYHHSPKEAVNRENRNNPIPTPANLCCVRRLTKEDIRTIIREEVRPIIKEEIAASEKRMKEYIDLKIEAINAGIDAGDKSLNAKIDAGDKSLNARIDNVEKRIDDANEYFDPFWIVIIIIVIAIILPQILLIYNDRGWKKLETDLQQLSKRVQAMENASL